VTGREIRVGVVGAGFWANEMHLPAFATLPGVRVVHLAGGSSERTEATARRFGVERWTTDYRELVADGTVDVVDILAPNDLHAPVAIEAAAAGKHVICIKPLARTVTEADAMLAAAERAGTRLLYAENVPFIPAVQEARRVVDSGEIGDVYRVKACEGIPEPHAAWHLDPERAGGGVMIDMAVHSIEFCRFIAGAAIRSVYAETGTFVHRDRMTAEDTAVLTLGFENGVIGQCEDSWGLAGAMDSRFEIFGTAGRILVDNLHRQPLQIVTGAHGWSYPLPIPGAIADGHVAMLEHFLSCLRDETRARSEAADGRAALAVIEAAARSSTTGRRELVRSSTIEVTT
jgi:predicted dehydrogenase